MKSRVFHFLALAFAALAIALQFHSYTRLSNAARIKGLYINLPNEQRGEMETEAAEFQDQGQKLAIAGWSCFIVSIGLLIISKIRGESETPILVIVLFFIFLLLQMIRV